MHGSTLCSVPREVPSDSVEMGGFGVSCGLVLAVQTACTARGVFFEESICTVKGWGSSDP